MNKQASAEELYEKIAEEAMEYGFVIEMDTIKKEASAATAASGGKTIMQGIRELMSAGKGHVKTFWKSPKSAFGPQTWRGYVKSPGVKETLQDLGQQAKAGAPKDVISAQGKAFREMGMSDISTNNSALKGLGIAAGGIAATGLATAGAINALTPPRRVRIG